jgi:aminopeptidase
MTGKISSVVSSSEKLDISKLSFEERLQYGAENAVRCMGVTSQDRVFIITDYDLPSPLLLSSTHHKR